MLIHKYKLIFIHIPKNAGTSVVNFFLGEKSTEINEEGHGHKFPFPHKEYVGKYYIFSIVRDPLSRFLSAYNYAQMEESYWHTDNRTDNRVQHPDHELLHGKSIEYCVRKLYQNKLRHMSWLPQRIFLMDDEGHYVYDYLCKLENLNREIQIVFERIGMQGATLQKENESKPATKVQNLKPATIKKIYHFYRSDAKLFGYHIPETDLLKRIFWSIQYVFFRFSLQSAKNQLKKILR